jgi:hypothetical protein
MTSHVANLEILSVEGNVHTKKYYKYLLHDILPFSQNIISHTELHI